MNKWDGLRVMEKWTDVGGGSGCSQVRRMEGLDDCIRWISEVYRDVGG